MARHQTSAKDRIPARQLIAYGVGGIIPIALFNIAGQLVALIGNISLGLSAIWLGVILIVPRLWDAVSDPIVGHLSDNTRTRWGRRRPYLLVGGIAVALSFVLMWWVPKGDLVQGWFGSQSGYQWFQLGYILICLLIFFTACTVFEIPHGALGMEMSSDYHERTRLFSAKSFLGNLFAMSTPWLFALANLELFKGAGGNEADGMRYVSMIVAAVLIPLSFWWFFAIREPGFEAASQQVKTPFWQSVRHTAGNKTFLGLVIIIFTLAMGFNFVNLLGYYIPIFYLFDGDKVAAGTLLGINGTIWAITGLIAVFPLNLLSRRFGKRRTLLIAIALMCAAQLSKIYCYNPQLPYLIIIPTILLSAGMLFFFTLGASMVGDVCDEDDLNRGHRSEGSFYSIYWWFIKLGTAFASFVTGLLIVFTQFDESQVAIVDALRGSVAEARVHIESLRSAEENETSTASIVNDALDYAANLESFLDNETRIAEGMAASDIAPLPGFDQGYLTVMRARTERGAEGLRAAQKHLGSGAAVTRDETVRSQALRAADLIVRTGIERPIILSLRLDAHLSRGSEQSRHEAAHFDRLLDANRAVRRRLSDLVIGIDSDSIDTESFTAELAGIEQSIVGVLTKQSPNTLFRMRLVEIGLPLLLSLISIAFALRYPLSEDRCYEIKEALEARNREAATA